MFLILSLNDTLLTARIEDVYHVILFSNYKYIHHHVFPHLIEAVELLNKIEKHGKINLAYWDILSDEIIIHHKYLFKKKEYKKAHIWTGKDTICRMWSTGGLGYLSAGYCLFDNCAGREICTMCVNVQHKNKF